MPSISFCRLVLCHLKEPEKAVAQMAKLFAGRASVWLTWISRHISQCRIANRTKTISMRCIPYQTKINVDYSVGLKLPQLLMDAGLRTDAVLADQPIFRDGPEKHLWEKTWTFALQRAVPEGVVSMDRGMELIAGMERHTASPDVWVAVAKMFAAVGSKRQQ
jgi:hypothetical protein